MYLSTLAILPRVASFDHYELVETSLGTGRKDSSEQNLESGFMAIKKGLTIDLSSLFLLIISAPC